MRWTFVLFFVSLIQLILADECEDAKPDFSAPGRRISEQKCFEYSWQRKQLDKCSKDEANTDYPYMGFLGYKRKDKLTFLCGAFLISSKFAVTPAYCITVPTSYGFWRIEVVRFGNKNLDNMPHLDVKVNRTIPHKYEVEEESLYDIGLVELRSEVSFTKSVYPGCLWTQKTLPGVENTFSPGWPKAGADDKKDNVISELKIHVMKNTTCFEHLNVILMDSHICANESIHSIPNFSSDPVGGGVMVTQFNLDDKEGRNRMPFVLGVMGHGEQSAIDVNVEIGIYTSISSSLDWIEQNVWG